MLTANRVIYLTAKAESNKLLAERWQGIADDFRRIAERLDEVLPIVIPT